MNRLCHGVWAFAALLAAAGLLCCGAVLCAQGGAEEEQAGEPAAEAGDETDPVLEKVIEFWKPLRPHRVQQILRMKEQNPGEYREMLEHAARQRLELLEMQRENPERAREVLEREKLEGLQEDAVYRYHHAESDEERARAKADLKQAAEKAYKMKLEEMEREARRLEQELGYMKKRLDIWKKQPDLVIEDRMMRMMGKQGYLDF